MEFQGPRLKKAAEAEKRRMESRLNKCVWQVEREVPRSEVEQRCMENGVSSVAEKTVGNINGGRSS